jgi:hypothetical protein
MNAMPIANSIQWLTSAGDRPGSERIRTELVEFNYPIWRFRDVYEKYTNSHRWETISAKEYEWTDQEPQSEHDVAAIVQRQLAEENQ